MSNRPQYLKCPNCDSLSKHRLKYRFKNFNLYICSTCANGFINPIPKDIRKYYPDNYWRIPGILGVIKDRVYNVFQSRRAKWIRTYMTKGVVLDVGAGEASFAKKIRGFEVVSIDFPGSEIKNPDVLKVDFLKWNTSRKFDAIVFWESLEHVPAGKYLKKSFELLKKGSLIFIECPCFSSFESKLFKKNWYHLDPPRHLAHFSEKGMAKILRKQNFELLSMYKVFAPEYVYTGFLASLLKSWGFNPMESYIKKNNLYLNLFFAAILMPLSVIAESLFFLLDQSPIMLIVARKPK